MKNPNDQYKNPDSSLKGSSFYSMAIDDDDLLDCFVHLPDQAGIPFVLDHETIADAQTRDAELQQLAQREPTKFVRQMLAPNTHVWCYIKKNIMFHGRFSYQMNYSSLLLDGTISLWVMSVVFIHETNPVSSLS
jgi:hypothetical protein